MARITNKVRLYRKTLSLRQEDLAELCSVSRQTIIAIENEKYNPSLELAMNLSRLLGKTVEEVFQQTQDADKD